MKWRYETMTSGEIIALVIIVIAMLLSWYEFQWRNRK